MKQILKSHRSIFFTVYTRLLVSFSFIFTSIIGVGVTSSHAKSIYFGVYTSDKPTAMYEKFNPMLEYLQNSIHTAGKLEKLKMKIYPTYKAALKALVTGDCDFVRFGPASYITAKEINPGIRLLAMEHKNGQKRFDGVFIVGKDSDITNIKELKGRTFAFGDRLSTIGRYLSQAELIKKGITASGLKEFTYLGRHDKVALAVAVGKWDAGVVKENTFKKYAESRGLKVIGRFLNVTKPWVARSGLAPDLFGILRDALIQLTDKSVLKKLKQDGFFLVTDKDYDFVRRGMALSLSFSEE